MTHYHTADLWREGEYIDLWSLVHFLTGVVAGFIPVFLKLPFVSSFLFFVLFTILWEFFETYNAIKESKKNSIIDIIIAAIGFTLTVIVISLSGAGMFLNIVLFTTIGGLLLFLNIVGWRAYKRRGNY